MTRAIQDEVQKIDYQTLLEGASEAVIVTDRDGKIVWINRRSASLFGFDAAEMIGQIIDILVPENRRAEHSRLRQEFAAHPRNRPMGRGMELEARRKDGSTFPVEVSLSIATSNDRLLVMALVADISGRRALERSLAENEGRQRTRNEVAQAFFARLMRPPGRITAGLLGEKPLRENAPDVFAEMAAEYRRIFDLSLQKRIYRDSSDLSANLRDMSHRLGFLKVDPRDLIDLHSTVLKEKCEGALIRDARAYLEEGHLLLIELMGNLVNHYRHLAVIHRKQMQKDS